MKRAGGNVFPFFCPLTQVCGTNIALLFSPLTEKRLPRTHHTGAKRLLIIKNYFHITTSNRLKSGAGNICWWGENGLNKLLAPHYLQAGEILEV